VGVVKSAGWIGCHLDACHTVMGCRSDRRERTGNPLMALTLEKEQRLHDVGLIVFFEKERDMWAGVLKRAYSFTRIDFPQGARIRRDDLIKPLLSVVEINEALRDFLSENKLRGKFWKELFVDLIIDRTLLPR
jgi:hypothetical protein